MDIKKLANHINDLKLDLNVKKTRVETLTQIMENIQRENENQKLEVSEQALLLLQKLSESQREIAKSRLEELGTQALQYSVSPNKRIVMEISKDKKKPEARLIIVDDLTGVETDPLEEEAGGIVDVVSLAMRIIMLVFHEPFIDGPIILDEPLKMLSKEYVPMMSNFLKKVSEDFGRQIIMVTHDEFLGADCGNVIQF